MLHEAIALILDEKIQSDTDLVGFEHGGVTLTQALYDEMIKPALDFFDEHLDREIVDMGVEQRVAFQSIPGAFGTADIIGRTEQSVVILDWKFGRGVPVSAVENTQGLFYAAAAAEDPKTAHYFKDVDTVEIIVVQPAFDPPFSRWTAPLTRLTDLRLKLISALRQSEQNNPPMEAGDHCRWCAAKPVCPLLQGMGEQALAETPSQLDPEGIGEWLDKAVLLEKWIKAVRELAHTTLEEGGEVADWKLVAKRATRKWGPGAEEQVREFARRSKKVRIADMYNSVLKSPPQTEKVLKAAGVDRDTFKDYIDSGSSGTTLAPESDPRPAVPQLGSAIKRIQNQLAGN